MRTDWQEKRLKFIAPLSRRILPGKPLDARYLGLENIESGTGKLHLETEQELVESSVISFDGNSILFGKLRPYLAKVATPDFDGVASTEIMVLLPANGNDRGFLAYSLRSDGFIRRVSALTDGAKMPRANPSNVMNLDLPLPSFFLQRRIAAYLDRQTEKIDRLMNLRKRQIELLKEQRAAIIQRAVTRGLKPDAPRKDSGIPWLGEIPAHWEVKRGRFLVLQGRSSIKPGPFGTQLKTGDYVPEGVKVFNQETVINGDFGRGEDFVPSEKFEQLSEFETKPGDLLLTTRGTIGRCAIVPKGIPKAIIHPCLMRIRLDPQVMTNEYAVAVIENTNLFLRQVNYLSNATTIEVIYSENFRQVFFPVPPLEEQNTITAWLNNPNQPINSTINCYSRQLALLAEYRAALIHECVTGRKEIPEMPPLAREVAHAL